MTRARMIFAATLIAGTAARDTAQGLHDGVAIGWLSAPEAAALEAAHALCWSLLQTTRLLGDQALDPDRIGAGARQVLLRETGQETMAALAQALDEATARAGCAIDAALARNMKGG